MVVDKINAFSDQRKMAPVRLLKHKSPTCTFYSQPSENDNKLNVCLLVGSCIASTGLKVNEGIIVSNNCDDVSVGTETTKIWLPLSNDLIVVNESLLGISTLS